MRKPWPHLVVVVRALSLFTCFFAAPWSVAREVVRTPSSVWTLIVDATAKPLKARALLSGCDNELGPLLENFSPSGGRAECAIALCPSASRAAPPHSSGAARSVGAVGADRRCLHPQDRGWSNIVLSDVVYCIKSTDGI